MEKRCSFAFMTLNSSMLCHHMLICVGAVDFLFQNCVNGVYPLILTVNHASFFAYILPINLSHKSSKKVKQKNKFRHAIKKSKVYLYSTAVFSTREMKKVLYFFAKHKKKNFYLTCWMNCYQYIQYLSLSMLQFFLFVCIPCWCFT